MNQEIYPTATQNHDPNETYLYSPELKNSRDARLAKILGASVLMGFAFVAVGDETPETISHDTLVNPITEAQCLVFEHDNGLVTGRSNTDAKVAMTKGDMVCDKDLKVEKDGDYYVMKVDHLMGVVNIDGRSRDETVFMDDFANLREVVINDGLVQVSANDVIPVDLQGNPVGN